MKRLTKRWAGLMLGIFLISGCTRGPEAGLLQGQGETEKLNVVTTLFPYYDFTRQIAGDAIELTMVIPAGMDSHSFEPTPADMMTIQNADLLICNGGEMERWLEQVLDAVDISDMTVVTMMDYVDALEEEHVEGMEDAVHHDDDGFETEIEYDEHIWTSPVNAMKITEVICDALIEADPVNDERYEAGAGEYVDRLEELHQSFLQVVRDEKRNVIVMGDKFPFRYLADEYGFSYRAAFSGCSTDTEPSAKTIAYLIDKVKEQKIPAVYYLELSSRRVSEIIGEETGALPMLLHSCHNVSRAEFDAGITYLDLMRVNAENLRKGLDE